MQIKNIFIAMLMFASCVFATSPSILAFIGNGAPANGTLSVNISTTQSNAGQFYNRSWGAITNGSWGVTLGEENDLSLNQGQYYYLAYAINGTWQQFINNTGDASYWYRFQSPVGELNSSFIINVAYASLGNWSADKPSYYTMSQVEALQNLTYYTTTANLPTYTNGTFKNITAGTGLTGGFINVSGTIALNDSYVSALFPVYNNGTSNLTLAQVVASIGNLSAENSTILHVGSVNNLSLTNFSASNGVIYDNTTGAFSANSTYISALFPVYNNGTSNLTLAQVVASIGNWTGNQSSYYTMSQVEALQNLTYYTTTANLPTYTNGTFKNITAGTGLTGGFINVSGTIALNDSYVSALFPVYNNGTSNLTLAQVVASIGNWTGNQSSYYTMSQVEALQNLTYYTTTANLPTYTNGTFKNITAGTGLTGGFINVSGTIALNDSYVSTLFPVYNNGTSNLTLAQVVASIGNLSAENSTILHVGSVNNLSLTNFSASNGVIYDNTTGAFSANSTYISALFPVYNNGTSNLTLAQVVASIGNWTGNQSSYYTMSQVEALQNLTYYTTTANLPTYTNGTFKNITAGTGLTGGFINVSGTIALNDSYVSTLFPVYNNGTSNLTLAQVVASIGNLSAENSTILHVGSVNNLSLTNFSASNGVIYDNTTGAFSANSTYISALFPVYNNGTSNLTLAQVVASIGNWTGNQSSYYTMSQVEALQNLTYYTTTANLPTYTNGTFKNITAGTGLTGGFINVSGTIALNDSYVSALFPVYNNGTSNLTLAQVVASIGNLSAENSTILHVGSVNNLSLTNFSASNGVIYDNTTGAFSANSTYISALFPVYNNGTSNLTLAQVVASIGNWTGNQSSYYTMSQVEALQNLTYYTTTANLPTYTNGTFKNITAGTGLTGGFINVSGTIALNDSYVSTLFPVYNNGTSNLTLAQVVASIGNLSAENSTILHVGSVNNLSLTNFSASNGVIYDNTTGAFSANSTYISALFPVYNNGTSNLTLAQVVASIGNWTGNQSSYYTMSQVEALQNLTYYTTTANLPTYTNGTFKNITAGTGLTGGFINVSGTIALNDSYVSALFPVYNNGTSNLTLAQVVASIGNLSAENSTILHVGSVNNLSLTNFSASNGVIYDNTTGAFSANSTYISALFPVYNNGTSNLTLAQVVASIGNWTGNQSSYYTMSQVEALQNLTYYTTTANLPTYTNGTFKNITAGTGLTGGFINVSGTIALNDSYVSTLFPVYNNGTSNLTLAQVVASIGNLSAENSTILHVGSVNNLSLTNFSASNGVIYDNTTGAFSANSTYISALFPVYNNGTSNLTLAQVVASIGNWTGNQSSYYTMSQVEALQNLTYYTTTANLPTYTNGTFKNITAGTGLTGGFINVSGTIALNDSYVSALFPVYNNGTSNLTLAQVVASIGNWTGNQSSYYTMSQVEALQNLTYYTTTANLPTYTNGTFKNITAGTGLTGGFINVSGTIALNDSYVNTLVDNSSIARTNISNVFTANQTIAYGLTLNTTTTKGTCAATLRGQFWVDQGGAGVSDLLWICIKNSTDNYNWVQISIG